MNRKPARLLRIAAFCAVLLPFLLSSLIATGVMPARAADGAITLVICNALGPSELRVDPDTLQPIAPEKDAPKDKTGSACAWAASHAEFAPPMLPALALPVRRGESLPAPALSTILATARATGLPPATGPPLSA